MTAYEFHSSHQFVTNSDLKHQEYEKALKGWNQEKLYKEQEQQLIKRKIHEVEQKTPSNCEKESQLKDKINEIEKQRFELELKGKQFTENSKKFVDFKKRLQR